MSERRPGQTSFLDFVREADARQGRGNDELVRALLPLIEQALEHHDQGRVAPLLGVDRIFADGGHLWFHDVDASTPSIDHKAVRALERQRAAGVEIVDRKSVVIDVDHVSPHEVASNLVGRAGEPVAFPVYLPDYVTWEDEVGHHDALTDIFSLGMLLASLALGADFTEPEELERFVANRHRLTSLSPTLHPVIAKAIVRMTELDRRSRAQDLRGLAERLRRYREVDGRADEALDFRKLEGFTQADRSTRRKIIQAHLQSRLFDVTRRNRLIYFRPTLSTLDLTESSVPTQLDCQRVEAEDLLLWNDTVSGLLSSRKPLRLDRYLRFEETPYARGVLDKIRAQARRDHAEVGSSQLRLVLAFFNWHNLRDAPDDRIRSPLLLLPARLDKKRGVRDSYVLTPTTDVAEVNPVLRHLLVELYDLELPEHVDLGKTDLATFHEALRAEIARSEPGITLRCLTKPQIRIIHQRARRRLAAWRRRSKVSGRGIRRLGDVSYSYARTNLRPLGLQLFLQKVKPQRLALAEHYELARPIAPSGEESSRAASDATEAGVEETAREVYQMTEEATGRFDWAVDLTHLTLGNFNYRKMSLVRDYDEILEASDDGEHPAFDTLFSLEARELAAPPDAVSDTLAPYVVVPADPTQTAALRWAREGKNFIIQGPPGTGKSQTITNLIADFAGRGKRVLFVCEKRAALDVVYHRLAQHGLDELAVLIHDSQADKKPFLTELGATYERWLAASDDADPEDGARSREALLEGLSEPLDALARFSASMVAPAASATVSVGDLIRDRVRHGPAPELSAEQRERLPGHAAWSEGRDAVYALSSALGELGESTVLAELPLLGVSPTVLESERPQAVLREGLDAIDALLEEVGAARELVRPGATAQDLREALALATEVAELADAGQLALLDPKSGPAQRLKSGLARRAEQARALDKATAKTSGWRQKLARGDLGPALELARRFDAIFILFLFFLPAWWRLRGVLLSHYDFAKHTVKPGWTAVLGELDAEYAEREALEEIDDGLRREFAFEGDVTAFEARVEALRSTAGSTPLQADLKRAWSAADGAVVVALRAAAKQIDALAAVVARVFDDAAATSIEDLEERVARVRGAADLLQALRAPLLRVGAAEASVKEALRTIPLTAEALDASVVDVTLQRTFVDNRPLARFDHAALDRRRAQLSERHGAWLAANARAVRRLARDRFLAHVRLCGTPAAKLSADEKVLKKAYNAGRRVLEREFNKVMRHRSIRELSSGDAGTVLYDLKPIWLMSPLSISDTIPLLEQRFDVVIFDEASQIPVEEAVPALYRAPQMIVVGDEMQLPPTSFFATKRDADKEEEEAHYDLDADSFLTHASRKLPSTMLGWHYRSRSEALIRFSSHAFYDGKLLTVPDQALEVRREPIVVERVEQGDENAARVVDRPISFHRMVNGVYATRRNATEARYIAHLVRGLLRAEHRHSVGIVAFSEAQQAEIESALDMLAREDEAFSASLEAEYERTEDGQVVGLFVKNLENVQGDERDVIILSICYGPDANDKMRMNFGPINKGGGEKRLNVVFSRAKRHMAVVSSIGYGAITNEYNEGALTFRRYLQYAEAMSVGDADTATLVTQVLSHGPSAVGEVRSPEDPVVDQLAEALVGRGYRVERDIGTSAFRVDVGVCKPGDEELALGLLVDTAAHYDNDDLMERYHTRPAVLEAFGWSLEWVLAKDWVADRDACLERIERAYERALSR